MNVGGVRCPLPRNQHTTERDLEGREEEQGKGMRSITKKNGRVPDVKKTTTEKEET